MPTSVPSPTSKDSDSRDFPEGPMVKVPLQGMGSILVEILHAGRQSQKNKILILPNSVRIETGIFISKSF